MTLWQILLCSRTDASLDIVCFLVLVCNTHKHDYDFCLKTKKNLRIQFMCHGCERMQS